MDSRSDFSGNTSRAMKLPNGSCCQLRKWSAGSTVSEYDSIGVRECGAGRSRTTCGWIWTGRSKVYVVRCSSATVIPTPTPFVVVHRLRLQAGWRLVLVPRSL